MTHTIHPAQLEAVARVIDPEAFAGMHSSFYSVAPKGTPREEVEHAYKKRMIPRKKAAYKKAKAAILAAFKPLPIEDAPTDGSHVLLEATVGQMLTDNTILVMGHYSRGWWGGGSTLSHVKGFIPIPQETCK